MITRDTLKEDLRYLTVNQIARKYNVDRTDVNIWCIRHCLNNFTFPQIPGKPSVDEVMEAIAVTGVKRYAAKFNLHPIHIWYYLEAREPGISENLRTRRGDRNTYCRSHQEVLYSRKDEVIEAAKTAPTMTELAAQFSVPYRSMVLFLGKHQIPLAVKGGSNINPKAHTLKAIEDSGLDVLAMVHEHGLLYSAAKLGVTAKELSKWMFRIK